jgi:hypothetical protein
VRLREKELKNRNKLLKSQRKRKSRMKTRKRETKKGTVQMKFKRTIARSLKKRGLMKVNKRVGATKREMKTKTSPWTRKTEAFSMKEERAKVSWKMKMKN